MPHVPVLLHEAIAYLAPKPGDFIIDGTVGGGGHAKAIAEKIAPGGMLLGVDWDKEMVKKITLNLKPKTCSTIFVHGNYADISEILRKRKLPKANGLLLDLGFSSEQIATRGRGFSFMHNEPLLMTYDDSREPVKALLRRIREDELADILFTFGEERYARRIAKEIKAEERRGKIETTGVLVRVIERAVPNRYAHSRLNPATRTFQALRIYANDELGNLERALRSLGEVLASGGRAVIVSFHSLEDRLVKNYFKTFGKEKMNILTKKPIVASRAEIAQNPRSRSAKLRAAELY